VVGAAEGEVDGAGQVDAADQVAVGREDADALGARDVDPAGGVDGQAAAACEDSLTVMPITATTTIKADKAYQRKDCFGTNSELVFFLEEALLDIFLAIPLFLVN